MQKVLRNVLIVLVLFNTQATVHAATPPVVYVTGDSSGDYTCDGSSDQVQLNQAIEFVATHDAYTTVYLKGPYTYPVDEPIIMHSNTKLTGDATATVKLIDNVADTVGDWDQEHGNKPVIAQEGAEFWEGGNDDTGTWTDAIYGTDASTIENAEISGFTLEIGQQDGYSDGKYWYAGMYFFVAKNLSIHDMILSNAYTDMIRIMTKSDNVMSDNIQLYNLTLHKTGHEGIYISHAGNLQIFDNDIFKTRTNTGIRLNDCTHIAIHDNTIYNDIHKTPSGYAGIEVRTKHRETKSLDISNNFIYGKSGGIVLRVKGTGDYSSSIQDIHIHHNRLYAIFDNTAGSADYLNGGIHLHGFPNAVIENNVIDGSWKDGIIYEEYPGSTATGYQTIVRNNIIRNSKGYAINNHVDNLAKHTFVADYNDLFNNAVGNYNHAASTTDIHAEPLFINAPADYGTPLEPDVVDFHLQSAYGRWTGSEWLNDTVTSPCIDSGAPSSDFSLEPLPNGQRINMGVYGNTAEASKSSDTRAENTNHLFIPIRAEDGKVVIIHL